MKRLFQHEAFMVMAGQMGQFVLTFATSLMVARSLGAEGYGLVNLARTVLSVLGLVAALGLDVALLKFCGRHEPGNALVRATVTRLRLVAAATSLAVLFTSIGAASAGGFSRVFGHEGFDTIMIVSLLALPFAGDVGILGAVYRARGEGGRFALFLYMLPSTIRVVLVGVAVLLWPSVLAIAAINTIQIAVSALVILVDDRVRHGGGAGSGPIPARAEIGREARIVLGEALWLCLSIFVYGLMRMADMLFLGAYADAKSVGEYTALSTISQLIVFYSVAGSQSLGPKISNFYHAGDRAGLAGELRAYVHRAAIVSGFMFAGIAVFGERLDLVFGKGFHFDPVICFVLPLSALLSATLAPIGYALSMTGRHRQENAILTAGAVLLVSGCWVLVPRYGQIGAAGAVAISFLAVNVVRFAYTARVHGFIPGRLRDVLPPLVGLTLAYGSRAAVDAVGSRGLLGTVAATLLFTAAFALVYRSEIPRLTR